MSNLDKLMNDLINLDEMKASGIDDPKIDERRKELKEKIEKMMKSG